MPSRGRLTVVAEHAGDWIDVHQSEHGFGFVDLARRQLAGEDLAEDAVVRSHRAILAVSTTCRLAPTQNDCRRIEEQPAYRTC